MGKKKAKARQLALNNSQAQTQTQPLSNPPQPQPNGTASGAVAQDAGASSVAQPTKKRRMTKAEKKRRRIELGIGKEVEALRREAEDLRRDAQSPQTSDLNPHAPATAIFSTATSSQNTKPLRPSRRNSRSNSFVGDTLLNVLEEVQGNDPSLPQNLMPASAQNELAVDGSNDKLTSEHGISTLDAAQKRAQDMMSRHAYNFAPGTMPPPAYTLPQTMPEAPYGYNMANATWDWNNSYGAGFSEGQQTTHAVGYQYQPPIPHGQNPGLMAGAWGQASAPPYGFPPAPLAMGQFTHVNPAWRIQRLLGPGGLAARISPHQRRSMEPNQYRRFAHDSRDTDLHGQQGIASRPRSPRKSPKVERPNKPGPPRPNPSPRYLARSLMESYRLNVPQRLLIVIDLNGTLLFRPKARQSSNFVQRPFTRPFISYLFANHDVMVWSSAQPENVNRMCSGLFSSVERKQLKAEWARDKLGLTAKQYNEKVQVFKELSKVWEVADAEQWHPMHGQGQRFDQRNTLLIDDSVEKATSEPYNLVKVDDFVAREDQMSRDVMREVTGYLEDARLQSDVSAWCRAGNSFAYGKGWDREWQEGVDAPSHSFDQVSFSQDPSGHLGDGPVPASLHMSHFGQEAASARLTRSQKKGVMSEETSSPAVSSDHKRGSGVAPAPPSTGDAGQAPGVQTHVQRRETNYACNRNAKNQLEYR